MQNWQNVTEFIFDILRLPDEQRPVCLSVTQASARFGKNRTLFNPDDNELYYLDTDSLTAVWHALLLFRRSVTITFYSSIIAVKLDIVLFHMEHLLAESIPYLQLFDDKNLHFQPRKNYIFILTFTSNYLMTDFARIMTLRRKLFRIT